MAAAQATLREARETRRAEQGALLPAVSGSAAGRATASVPGGVGLRQRFDDFLVRDRGTERVLHARRVRRYPAADRAAECPGGVSAFELEATDLTLAANVINAAINEASLQAQIETTQHIIRADTDALNLVRQRFQLGGVSQVDVLQQQSLLDSQVATLPGLRKQLQQTRNQLSVYLGGHPDQYAMPTLDLNA